MSTNPLPNETQPKTFLSHIYGWFRSPWFTIVVLLGGAGIGLYHPELALKLDLINAIYIDFLKLCVGPIVLSSVAIGIFDLFNQRSKQGFIINLIICLGVGIFLSSFIAALVGVGIAPSQNMSEDTLESLGIVLNTNIVDFSLNLNSANPTPAPTPVFQLFLKQLVPDNALDPLVSNEILKLIVVSAILGIGMNLIPMNEAQNLLNFLNAIQLTFNKILKLLTYLLPFALFSIVSYTFATVDGGIFVSLVKFIVATFLAFLVLIIVSVLIITLRSRIGLPQVINSLAEVTTVSLATQSVVATMPQSLNALTEHMRLSRREVNISLPLVMTLGRFGNIAYFATATILATFIYAKPLTLSFLLTITLLNIFAGVATAGAVGVATLTMIAITLDVLQIPSEAILTLLIVIDPIIAPFRVWMTVLASMGVVAAVASREPRPLHLFRTAVLRIADKL